MPADVALARDVRKVVDAVESVRPAYILVAFVALQWTALVVLALGARHNGWLWYTGGDGALYHTTAWEVAHLRVPRAYIGYGAAVATMPITGFGGPSLLASLPGIVLLQTLLLAPLELLLVYGIGRRLGGRIHGYAAALVWIAAPFAALRFWRPDYRAEFHDLFVPQWLGLTNIGDFPSTVLALAAAYLTFRALDERRLDDAVLAGLVAGFAVGVKPAQALFLPAPLLALLVARRWHQIGGFVVALAPAALTLTIWKAKGLGYIPILETADSVREAAGPQLLAVNPVQHYLDFSWHQFAANMEYLNEYGWSRRLAEYLPIAGVVGALRRSPPKGVLLAAWCFAFLVLKGGSSVSNLQQTSYFRLGMPGLPAYVLLATCIAFLWPRVRTLATPEIQPPPPRIGRVVVVVALLLGALPLAVVAVARPAQPRTEAYFARDDVFAPVSDVFDASARRTAAGTLIEWTPPPHGSSRVAYTVYAGTGDGCGPTVVRGVQICDVAMQRLGYTAIDRFIDEHGGPRTAYRVALTAGPEPREPGDELLVSPAVTAR